MHSAIYQGTIRHRRFEPVDHALQYRMFMLYLDLDELDTVFNGPGKLLWSAGRWNVACLLRKDHFGDPRKPLKQCVLDRVAEETGRRLTGPVRMLAHLRYFGYEMNPATFYYCYDAEGQRVEAVVTEIHNTPWGERHCYVLPRSKEGRGGLAMRFDKAFHVSPFMPMNHEYDWRFNPPPMADGGQLVVSMRNYDHGRRVFDASLVMRRYPLTAGRLNLMLVKFPLITVKVVVGIYWHALRLWLKKVPFKPHPKWQDPANTPESKDTPATKTSKTGMSG